MPPPASDKLMDVPASPSFAFPTSPPAPRKPLRKEENGTGVAEYPMTSSQSSKGVDANSAVV